MNTRTKVPFVIVAVLGIGWLGMSAGANNLHPEEGDAFTPVAKVADLMGWNKATGNKIKAALQGGDPDWEQVASDARVWAEIANVLSHHQPSSETKWHDVAGKFKEFAMLVATSAEKEDKQAASEAFGKAFSTCKACHDDYR